MARMLLTLIAFLCFTTQAQDTEAIDQDVSLEDLLNIKTTVASKLEESLDQSPGIVTVIDRKTIDDSGAKTLGDILERIPGIEISKGSIGFGESLDEYYFRGVASIYSQDVLLLLNGRNKFNDLVYSSPWMSGRISADMIERIEVVRGPGSPLYGGNAFSGVVNVITRDVAALEDTHVKAEAGTFQSYSGYGLHRVDFENEWKFGTQAKVFQEKGDRHDEYMFYEADDTGLAGTHRPKSDQITDGYNLSYDLAANITSPNDKFRSQLWYTDHDQHPYITNFVPTPNTNEFYYRVTQLMWNFDYKLSDHLKLGGNYSKMYWEWVGLDYATPTNKSGSVQNNSNAKLEISYDLIWGRNSILMGTSFEQERAWDPQSMNETVAPGLGMTDNPGTNSYTPSVRNNIAAYAQNKMQLKENLAVTLGLRYDHFQEQSETFAGKRFDSFNPRVAFVYGFAPKNTLKLLYGSSFRPPSTYEAYGTALGGTGGQAQRPEEIQTGEVAWINYRSFARLQLSVYKSHISDSIFQNAGFIFDNIGEVDVIGTEFEATARNWWMNVSWADSSTEKDGVRGRTQYVAQFMGNAGLKYNLSENLLTTLEYKHRGQRKGSTQVSPAMNTFNTKIKYNFSKDFVGSLGMTNIFNENARFPLLTYTQTGDYYYRGREVYVSVEYHL